MLAIGYVVLDKVKYMSIGLPITGCPAHDLPVYNVKFRPNEASILSLGADGKVWI